MIAEKYASQIEKVFSKYPTRRSAVMPLLYFAQEEYGYVTEQGIEEVAALCDMDPTQVRSIAGFYTMYSEKPKGKYWLQVCTDLACALRGADQFYEDLKAELNVDDGGTTEDGLFTVEHVMCLAACDKAPMLQCNFHFVEQLDMDRMRTHLETWRAEAVSQPAAEKPARARKTKSKAEPSA
jgi:NADH-quinone oxidoreductase subunit E